MFIVVLQGDCDDRLLTLLLSAALENPSLDKNAFGRETAALDIGRLRNAKSTPRVAHHAQSGHFLTSTVVKNTARLLHEVTVSASVQSRSPQGIMRSITLIKCFRKTRASTRGSAY